MWHQTRSVLCQPGDLIFLVSDGVHDNLHPRVLGLKAASLGLNFGLFFSHSLDVKTIGKEFLFDH